MNRWAAIARFGGVGDDLMAASPFMALKRMGYMTEMITAAPNHALYFHNPYIDKLSVKKTETDLPQDDQLKWQKWFESRANEYDVFGHMSHACEGRHALFRTMTSFWWPTEVRQKICAGNYLETVHDIVGAPYEFGPLFFSSEEEKEHALQVKKQIGERFILWVLSGTRVDKVYPYTTMAIPRIIKEIGAPVLIMGGAHEIEHSMAMAIKESVALTNGTRDGLHLAIPATGGEKCWPLRSSLSLALCADLVVTPDTGTAWAVAFEPMPKVLMLSHASVENIAKHWRNTIVLHADPERVPCWSCHRLHDDNTTCVKNKEGNGAACISDISVELLVTAVKTAWNSPLSLGELQKKWDSNVTLQDFPVRRDIPQRGKPALVIV